MTILEICFIFGALLGQFWLLWRWWRKHHEDHPDSRFSFSYFWKTLPSLVIWWQMVVRLSLKQVIPDYPLIGPLVALCAGFMFGLASMVLFKELENIAKKWFKDRSGYTTLQQNEERWAVMIVFLIVTVLAALGYVLPPDVENALLVLITFLIGLLGLFKAG